MLRVQEIRKEKGLSQTELARRAALSRSYLSMIEAGVKHPNARRLRQIAEALGVPVAALLETGAEEEGLREHMATLAALAPEDREFVLALTRRLAPGRKG